jgi:DNA-binding CsgD family transcriptional regulator
VFEALGYGGLMLGGDRQVLAHNSVAATILDGGLVLRDSRVVATDRASDMRLQRLIGAALTGSGPLGFASVGLRRKSRLPLLVLIHRLREDVPAAAHASRLLLVACDPERIPMPREPMLAEMFGLTPTEVAVSIGIAAGRQLAEIAADRGIGIETVRWYSKIIFGKTRTRGQAELAALLTRLAMLAPDGGERVVILGRPPQPRRRSLTAEMPAGSSNENHATGRGGRVQRPTERNARA